MRIGGIIAGFALCLAAPLTAQDSVPFEPAFSAEDDLDCAIFIGALIAELENQGEMTPDNQVALTSALTYFIGRFEAQRGTDIIEPMSQRYEIYLERNPGEIQQVCSVRMRAFFSRLQIAGSQLRTLQPQPPVSPDNEESPPE